MDILALSKLGRFRDIVTVLFKYGFDDVAERLHLPGKILISKTRIAIQEMTTWERLRHALEELGPTFVKFGQILSLRGDLLPASLIKELEKLQDSVAPVSYEEIMGVLKKALKNLEFLVVQDILNCETAKIADVILPGSSISEKEGSVTNLEGRIQSFHPVVSPPGKAKPDWEILDLLAAKLGNSSPYGSLEEIRREIRKLVPMYAALNGDDQDWITITSAKALFKSNGKDGLISFYPVVSTEEASADDDYPFTAIIGTLRYHLGSGTRTRASERIQGYDLAGKIEISPEDGVHLGVNDDDTVTVRSRFGSITREVRFKEGLGSRQIFVPTGYHDNDAMTLFQLCDMTTPGSSGWKTCQVQIEKV